VASASGVRSFTLAFITASACKAMWFNAYDPRTGWQLDEINRIRAAGGDVKISFGGASGIELAQRARTHRADRRVPGVVSATAALHRLRHRGFGQRRAGLHRPAQPGDAAAAGANSSLRISLTLPVLPEGLTRTAERGPHGPDAGVNIDLVNIMAMDYYRTGDYGRLRVQAANSTFAQLKSLYPTRTMRRSGACSASPDARPSTTTSTSSTRTTPASWSARPPAGTWACSRSGR